MGREKEAISDLPHHYQPASKTASHSLRESHAFNSCTECPKMKSLGIYFVYMHTQYLFKISRSLSSFFKVIFRSRTQYLCIRNSPTVPSQLSMDILVTGFFTHIASNCNRRRYGKKIHASIERPTMRQSMRKNNISRFYRYFGGIKRALQPRVLLVLKINFHHPNVI